MTHAEQGRRELRSGGIEGEGLLLRPPAHGDRRRWLEMYADPDELRWGLPVGVPVPGSIEEMDEHVTKAAAAWAEGTPGSLVVSDTDDPGHLLGVVAWRRDGSPLLSTVDVGYVVHPDARRRGVGTRALRVLTRWLTTDGDGPRQARVQLDHSVENLASCTVAVRAGFEREGVRRAYLPLRDPEAPGGVRRHDVCLHGFVAGV